MIILLYSAHINHVDHISVKEAADSEDDDDEVGGLFRIAKRTNEERQVKKVTADALDCSRFAFDSVQDWDLEEVRNGAGAGPRYPLRYPVKC